MKSRVVGLILGSRLTVSVGDYLFTLEYNLDEDGQTVLSLTPDENTYADWFASHTTDQVGFRWRTENEVGQPNPGQDS